MSLTNYIGALQTNLLEENPAMCKLIRFQSPIIINTDLGKIKSLQREEFSNITINMVFDANGGGKALQDALDRICREAEQAVDNKINYLILSDRAVDKDHAPIPSLLAVSTLHHYLIGVKKRMQIGFIVETAEAREVMHFALLLGYGASVINPYMAFAVLDDMCKKGEIPLDYKTARQNYIKAIDNGLLKIMSKMGISTLRSYHGSQIFEAIGLSNEIVEKYFNGTPSNIGGIGLEEIAEEALIPHREAFRLAPVKEVYPKTVGIYHWRKDGNFMDGIQKPLLFCSGQQRQITTINSGSSVTW
jgi:glutamate synthase (NADPH/NADH) large chain